MLLVALGALPLAAYRWLALPLERDAVYITLFWNAFNLLLVLLCLGAVWEKRQLRRKHRIRTSETAAVRPMGSDRVHAAAIFDLSEDGVGFNVEDGADLKVGDRVHLLARDSSGHDYELLILLRRTSENPDGGVTCGAEFLGQDEFSWLDIVSYVYGDSQRWERFWEKRRLHRENAWSGIAYLAWKGLTGSARNFSGLSKMMWHQISSGGAWLWNQIKSEPSSAG
jgi:cellulose synthase (UDP-forming)